MVKALEKAWDGIGIVQHHDSMPGTMSAEGMYTTWGTSDLNSTKLQIQFAKRLIVWFWRIIHICWRRQKM